MKVKEYVFQKKNGEIRVLRGTQDYSLFAKQYPVVWDNICPVGGKVVSEQNSNIITIIDLETKSWKSIRKDSIISEREVKGFYPRFNIYDYEGRYKANPNYIKKDKVPYHTLMIIGHSKGLTRNEIETEIDYILCQENRDLRVRGNKIHAISRSIRLFLNNYLIKMNKSGKYVITSKGQKFLTTSVI